MDMLAQESIYTEPRGSILNNLTPRVCKKRGDDKSFAYGLDTMGNLRESSGRGDSYMDESALFMLLNTRLLPVDVSFRKGWMSSIAEVSFTNKQVMCTVSGEPGALHVVIQGVADRDIVYVALEAALLCPRTVFDSYSMHYGLTRAEASVLWMLSEGYEPKKISSLKGTAESTVRSQIKSILEKTGERAIRRLLIRLGRLAGAEVFS